MPTRIRAREPRALLPRSLQGQRSRALLTGLLLLNFGVVWRLVVRRVRDRERRRRLSR